MSRVLQIENEELWFTVWRGYFMDQRKVAVLGAVRKVCILVTFVINCVGKNPLRRLAVKDDQVGLQYLNF